MPKTKWKRHHYKLFRYISKFRKRLRRQNQLLEALIALPLGIPDGVTYGHFGLLAGLVVANFIGVSGIPAVGVEYFVGLSAALGVAFFAINNVSREFRNWQRVGLQLRNWHRHVLRKRTNPEADANKVFINHPTARMLLRFLALFIAIMSAIPFAGMALNATLSMSHLVAVLVITTNSLARIAMNDYALANLINKMFNEWVNRGDAQRKKLLARCDAFKRQIYRLPLTDHLFASPPADFAKDIMARIETTEPLVVKKTPLRRALRVFSQLLGFVAGAFTATYIFGFARDAVKTFGIHSFAVANTVAVIGVIPTAALWGDDTMTIFKRFYLKVRSWFISDAKPTVQAVTPTRLPAFRRILKVVLFLSLAVCGAFSESKMAFDFAATEPAGFYTFWLKVFAPWAFLAIYGISVLELTDKIISLVDKRLGGPVSKQLHLFETVEEIEKGIAEMG